MSCENKACEAIVTAATNGAAAPPVVISRLPWETDERAILNISRQTYIAMLIAEEGLPDDEDPGAFMERAGQDYVRKVMAVVEKDSSTPEFDWLAERVGEREAALHVVTRLLHSAHKMTRSEFIAKMTSPMRVLGGAEKSSPEALGARHAEWIDKALSGPDGDWVDIAVVADYPDLAAKHDILLAPPPPPFPEDAPALNAAYTRNAARRMQNQSWRRRVPGREIREWALFTTLNEAIYLPFGSVEAAKKFLEKNAGQPDPILTTNRGAALSAAELRRAIAAAREEEAKRANPPQVRFDSPPKLIDVKSACEQLGGDEFVFKFREPAQVVMGSRKREQLTELRARVFTARGGAFCYMPPGRKSTGYQLGYMEYNLLESISAVPKENAEIEKWRAESRRLVGLANAIHPNAWAGLKQEYLEQPEEFVASHGLKTANMRSVFGDAVVDCLKRAFDNRTEYRYSLPGKERDRSVHVAPQSDGSVRAWYSSEYAGTGNGSYYYLLNPTTALYIEDD